jgi:hypothetical protein
MSALGRPDECRPPSSVDGAALAIMESVIAAAPDDLANIRQLGLSRIQTLGNTG